MKKVLFLTLLILQTSNLIAQNPAEGSNIDSLYLKSVAEFTAKFSSFKEKNTNDYNLFLADCNKKYTTFLSQIWHEYKVFIGEEPPVRPIPLEPIIKDSVDIKTPPIELPIKEIVTIPSPKPVAPEFIPPSKEEPKEEFIFTFIGNRIAIGLTDKHHLTLLSTQEEDIADMWQTLSDGRMVSVVNDCLYWKSKMQLNDYFYLLMLDSMCKSFFDVSHTDEARLMKTYIMAQSGYDIKCGRKNDDLIVLLSIEETVYKTSFLVIDERIYYIIDAPEGGENKYYTFAQRFSEESKNCSMKIESEIIHPRNVNRPKTLASKRYPSLKVDAAADINLIEAYDSYPRCKWDVYAKAPMSSNLTSVLYPKIKSVIAGKSELEAANIILNFVQTAFEYKTDDEYFGYDRPLFVDEIFYYPYSDCEDRSILFSNLMRNILGVDVALIYYPNHLATAVKFKSNHPGDYMMINDEKYLVCDPTYIGAEIGVAMPGCKSVSAEVVVLF